MPRPAGGAGSPGDGGGDLAEFGGDLARAVAVTWDYLDDLYVILGPNNAGLNEARAEMARARLPFGRQKGLASRRTACYAIGWRLEDA